MNKMLWLFEQSQKPRKETKELKAHIYRSFQP